MLLYLLLPLVVSPQPLASYVDRNRVLLVFESVPSDGLARRQLDLLAQHGAELRERDVVVVPVAAGSHEPDRLHARFHISNGKFTVILLGKDGGEKLRQHTPLAYDKLAATIDAMPMRQDEMRKQN